MYVWNNPRNENLRSHYGVLIFWQSNMACWKIPRLVRRCSHIICIYIERDVPAMFHSKYEICEVFHVSIYKGTNMYVYIYMYSIVYIYIIIYCILYIHIFTHVIHIYICIISNASIISKVWYFQIYNSFPTWGNPNMWLWKIAHW